MLIPWLCTDSSCFLWYDVYNHRVRHSPLHRWVHCFLLHPDDRSEWYNASHFNAYAYAIVLSSKQFDVSHAICLNWMHMLSLQCLILLSWWITSQHHVPYPRHDPPLLPPPKWVHFTYRAHLLHEADGETQGSWCICCLLCCSIYTSNDMEAEIPQSRSLHVLRWLAPLPSPLLPLPLAVCFRSLACQQLHCIRPCR